MQTPVFSHRPLTGVSVGAFSHDGRLFFAVAIVNDGTSRNGNFHPDRLDAFSRKRARSIINGRLASLISGDTIAFGMTFDTNIEPAEFMREYRQTFKPDVEELDDTFVNVADLGGIVERSRMTANDIFSTATRLASEVIAHASARV